MPIVSCCQDASLPTKKQQPSLMNTLKLLSRQEDISCALTRCKNTHLKILSKSPLFIQYEEGIFRLSQNITNICINISKIAYTQFRVIILDFKSYFFRVAVPFLFNFLIYFTIQPPLYRGLLFIIIYIYIQTILLCITPTFWKPPQSYNLCQKQR